MIHKTPEEIAQMYTQVRQALINSNPSGYQTDPPARPSNPQPANAGPQPPGLPDPDLMYSDPARYQQEMAIYNQMQTQAMMAQMATPFVQSMSEMARDASMRDSKYDSTWKRWGHEIDAEMATIPHEMRTKAVYDRAAQLVRSNHIPEIVREEAERLRSSGAGLESPSGNFVATNSGGDLLDQFWAENGPFVQRAKSEQLTPNAIRSHLKAMGKSIDEYIKHAGQSGATFIENRKDAS